MIFKNAIKRLRNSHHFRNLGKDYFLVSLFSSFGQGERVSNWTLLFFNPKTKKTIDFNIGEDITKEESDAIKDYNELLIEKVEIDIEEAMKKIKPVKKPARILTTLHMRKDPCWTINMIYPTMSVKTSVINAINGKLIEEKETSLLRKS